MLTFSPTNAEIRCLVDNEKRRRKIFRMLQVRYQTRENARLMRKLYCKKKAQLTVSLASEIQDLQKQEDLQMQCRNIENLGNVYNSAGLGHSAASAWIDPNVLRIENDKLSSDRATLRFKHALAVLNEQKLMKRKKDSEPRERQWMVRSMEDERAKLISQLPKVESVQLESNPPDCPSSIIVLDARSTLNSAFTQVMPTSVLVNKIGPDNIVEDARIAGAREQGLMDNLDRECLLRTHQNVHNAEERGRLADARERVHRHYQLLLSRLEETARLDSATRRLDSVARFDEHRRELECERQAVKENTHPLEQMRQSNVAQAADSISVNDIQKPVSMQALPEKQNPSVVEQISSLLTTNSNAVSREKNPLDSGLDFEISQLLPVREEVSFVDDGERKSANFEGRVSEKCSILPNVAAQQKQTSTSRERITTLTTGEVPNLATCQPDGNDPTLNDAHRLECELQQSDGHNLDLLSSHISEELLERKRFLDAELLAIEKRLTIIRDNVRIDLQPLTNIKPSVAVSSSPHTQHPSSMQDQPIGFARREMEPVSDVTISKIRNKKVNLESTSTSIRNSLEPNTAARLPPLICLSPNSMQQLTILINNQINGAKQSPSGDHDSISPGTDSIGPLSSVGSAASLSSCGTLQNGRDLSHITTLLDYHSCNSSPNPPTMLMTTSDPRSRCGTTGLSEIHWSSVECVAKTVSSFSMASSPPNMDRAEGNLYGPSQLVPRLSLTNALLSQQNIGCSDSVDRLSERLAETDLQDDVVEIPVSLVPVVPSATVVTSSSSSPSSVATNVIETVGGPSSESLKAELHTLLMSSLIGSLRSQQTMTNMSESTSLLLKRLLGSQQNSSFTLDSHSDVRILNSARPSLSDVSLSGRASAEAATSPSSVAVDSQENIRTAKANALSLDDQQAFSDSTLTQFTSVRDFKQAKQDTFDDYLKVHKDWLLGLASNISHSTSSVSSISDSSCQSFHPLSPSNDEVEPSVDELDDVKKRTTSHWDIQSKLYISPRSQPYQSFKPLPPVNEEGDENDTMNPLSYPAFNAADTQYGCSSSSWSDSWKSSGFAELSPGSTTSNSNLGIIIQHSNSVTSARNDSSSVFDSTRTNSTLEELQSGLPDTPVEPIELDVVTFLGSHNNVSLSYADRHPDSLLRELLESDENNFWIHNLPPPVRAGMHGGYKESCPPARVPTRNTTTIDSSLAWEDTDVVHDYTLVGPELGSMSSPNKPSASAENVAGKPIKHSSCRNRQKHPSTPATMASSSGVRLSEVEFYSMPSIALTKRDSASTTVIADYDRFCSQPNRVRPENPKIAKPSRVNIPVSQSDLSQSFQHHEANVVSESANDTALFISGMGSAQAVRAWATKLHPGPNRNTGNLTTPYQQMTDPPTTGMKPGVGRKKLISGTPAHNTANGKSANTAKQTDHKASNHQPKPIRHRPTRHPPTLTTPKPASSSHTASCRKSNLHPRPTTLDSNKPSTPVCYSQISSNLNYALNTGRLDHQLHPANRESALKRQLNHWRSARFGKIGRNPPRILETPEQSETSETPLVRYPVTASDIELPMDDALTLTPNEQSFQLPIVLPRPSSPTPAEAHPPTDNLLSTETVDSPFTAGIMSNQLDEVVDDDVEDCPTNLDLRATACAGDELPLERRSATREVRFSGEHAHTAPVDRQSGQPISSPRIVPSSNPVLRRAPVQNRTLPNRTLNESQQNRDERARLNRLRVKEFDRMTRERISRRCKLRKRT